MRYIAGFELRVSAPFVRFYNDLHPLHVLKPCKNRAETVHPWLTKQKSHEIFRSTASTVDIPNHWDLQQRRLRPVADARRSCWGSGQQDASAAQGTRRMLGAATRNSKQQPTGLIACGAVRRRLVRAPSIVQTKRKTSTQRVLVFLGAVKQSKSEPFSFDAAWAASSNVMVCVPSL